jgi:hypothetical protein
MQPIEGTLFSPFQRRVQKIIHKPGTWDFESELVWQRHDATVNKIRASEGFKVSSFRELMNEVAYVTISNRNYEMYYRGQSKDYKNNQSVYYKDLRTPKTTIYPTICRPEQKPDGTLKYSIKKSQIEKRYEELSEIIDLLRGRRNYFNEYYYALFQHYDILPTPFIDITQSLRVAATFALKKSEIGYVYVLGLPYPNQSISYFRDIGIVLMKLQNIVPPEALRPRFQEGFLVGKFPIRPTKENGDDLANRMVAKFLLDNSHGKFWDQYFQPMPDDVLYPSNDEIELGLLSAKDKFKMNTLSNTKK